MIGDDFVNDDEMMMVGVLVMAEAMAAAFARADSSYSKCAKL